MANRWLKNKKDGTIYEWNAILADNPLCEEITEEQAFPERFVPKAQRGRKAKIKLDTKDVPQEPDNTPIELAEEASRGLPE